MNIFHRVQARVLYYLRHHQNARYSELMHQTDLESDVFKFHIRTLVKRGVIEKLASGAYQLTSSGKELANNLDDSGAQLLRQPKLSVAIVVESTIQGETKYLMQQRLRQPFYGYWGCISGPAQWGEDFIQTAKQELAKQCGIEATAFAIRGFYRQTDYPKSSSHVLEDKLFVVVHARYVGGTFNSWSSGLSHWMTLAELKQYDDYFKNTESMIELVQHGSVAYGAGSTSYTQDQY